MPNTTQGYRRRTRKRLAIPAVVAAALMALPTQTAVAETAAAPDEHQLESPGGYATVSEEAVTVAGGPSTSPSGSPAPVR